VGPVWNVLDTSAALYRSITQWALTTPPWVHDFALFATQGLLVVFIALAALHWWFARTITALAVPLLAAALGWLVSDLTKEVVRQVRPCRELGLLDEVLAQCPEHDDWSLPSNHSAIAAAFAVALAAQWRKITSLVVLLALLEGFSRVFIGVHYPHDVLLGFFVGGMVAAVVVWASGSIVRRRVLAARAPEEG
jgi:membrane-associated phospholipid phosphatase